MTYSNVIEKFLIEYDKAQFSSSYPSLTDYEIATILDKAYLALIAQKVTGSNFRRAGFEADVKAVEDMRSLIVSSIQGISGQGEAENEYKAVLPSDFLYFVDGSVELTVRIKNEQAVPVAQPSVLMSHDSALTYKNSVTNLPWIKNPITYIQGEYLHILIDSHDYPRFPKLGNTDINAKYILTYVKKPIKFVNEGRESSTPMEINDSMVEELINLAIIMSAEIVESTRLQGKINTSALES